MKGYVFKRGETWTYVVDIGKDPFTGKRKQKTKGGYKRKKDAEAAIRKLLSEVDEGRYIEPSKEAFSSYKKEEMKIWTFENIHRFLDVCKGERTYLVFFLAIYTGMRRGEILGLKWEDIDFEIKLIHVKRSLAFIPENGYI
ncbi:Arm DNA-binding domain-containing protein [Peribacillus tepidiphilus]|uniref:Arm DNA-binding domain-containing protein n=1 Tax=Peribacillus tepidiphilus TaxID=2652445 RepID=UPI0035B56E8A